MRVRNILLALCLSAAPILGASIDGDWLIVREAQKGAVEFELKLKSDGDKLTGTYGRKGGRHAMEIRDGKIESDSFRFTVLQRVKDGDRKIVYEGKVVGDELKGEAGVEGRRMRPFTAKRQ